MTMTLFSGPLSMFGAKAEIAAREKAIPFDLVMVPFDMQRLYDPKHPEVTRINPKRQVPVLVDGPVEIFDSTQIFEYFEHLRPEPPLWPESPADRARARLIEHLSDEVYFPPVIRLMSLQDRPDDPAAVAAREAAAAVCRRLEDVIGEQAYLAGAYSYADIAFFMAQLFGERMGARLADDTPRLMAWRQRMGRRPAVRAVVGPMLDYLRGQGRPIPEPFQAIAAD
ncbi:MAG: glutathione S-transferase family protein [Phreatobacter sp.]|uniref:glutathione S-transferase family protein n=1 Tax=Phreatobacter sp. TaxID=1966341 RepID=UPI00403588CE